MTPVDRFHTMVAEACGLRTARPAALTCTSDGASLLPAAPVLPVHNALERRDTTDRGELHRAVFGAVLEGRGPFWPTNGWKAATDSPVYQSSQEAVIFEAVRIACAAKGISDAHRWQIVERAIRRQADELADYVASGDAARFDAKLDAAAKVVVQPARAFR